MMAWVTVEDIEERMLHRAGGRGQKNIKKRDPETETSRRFQTSRREEKDRMRRYAPVRSLNEGIGDRPLRLLLRLQARVVVADA